MSYQEVVRAETALIQWVSLVSMMLFIATEPAFAQRQISIPRDPANGYVGLSYRPTDFMEPDVQKRALPFVVSVVPCSPAHFAGVEPGFFSIERGY